MLPKLAAFRFHIKPPISNQLTSNSVRSHEP